MSLTGFIVLFTVIWFISFWCILPIGLRTQGDEDDIVKGTPAGAPANLNLKRKLLWTTVVAIIIWLPFILTIWLSGVDIVEIDLWAWMTGA